MYDNDDIYSVDNPEELGGAEHILSPENEDPSTFNDSDSIFGSSDDNLGQEELGRQSDNSDLSGSEVDQTQNFTERLNEILKPNKETQATSSTFAYESGYAEKLEDINNHQADGSGAQSDLNAENSSTDKAQIGQISFKGCTGCANACLHTCYGGCFTSCSGSCDGSSAK